jgi:hypothetical protein
MALPDTSKIVEELPRALRPAFAPLVKWAFGLAVAAVMAVLLFLLAAAHASGFASSDGDMFVWLLGNNFFQGYKPTWNGAFLGLMWGFGAGFISGWCLALFRNRIISIWVFFVGAKERLKANRDILEDLM